MYLNWILWRHCIHNTQTSDAIVNKSVCASLIHHFSIQLRSFPKFFICKCSLNRSTLDNNNHSDPFKVCYAGLRGKMMSSIVAPSLANKKRLLWSRSHDESLHFNSQPEVCVIAFEELAHPMNHKHSFVFPFSFHFYSIFYVPCCFPKYGYTWIFTHFLQLGGKENLGKKIEILSPIQSFNIIYRSVSLKGETTENFVYTYFTSFNFTPFFVYLFVRSCSKWLYRILFSVVT